MTEPGLKDAGEKAIAEQYVDKNINAALKELTQKTAYATQADKDAAADKVADNPLFPKVKAILKSAEEIADPQAAEKFKTDSLAQLRDKSVNAMIKGVENKKFGEIVGETLQNIGSNFDIFHPIDSIMNIVIGLVKDLALSFGGEKLAPLLKSMKSNFSGKAMTTDEAARSLRFQNAAAGLAESLGVSEDNKKGFAAIVANQMDELVKPAVTNVEVPAPASSLSAEAAEKARAEKAKLAGAGVSHPVDANNAPAQNVGAKQKPAKVAATPAG